jgi:hypothetical protein
MENIAAFLSNSDYRKSKWNFPDKSVLSLITDVGLNFFRFLKSLGISGESNLVILSSKDNYFCDESELKNARIIINLKRLNLIKHLDLFLNSLVRILPPDISFIGYFSDDVRRNENDIKTCPIIGNLKKAFHFFGSGRNHILNRSEVTEILEKNGFKTINMKKMNGLTYFISQNISIPQ